MQPIDMLSAYVIGGIGAWAGALMMLIAMQADRVHRVALSRCAWGFGLLGVGMVYSGFAERVARWPILALALAAAVGTLAVYRGLGALVGAQAIGARRLAIDVLVVSGVLLVAWTAGPRPFALVFHVLCLAIAIGITCTLRRALLAPRNAAEFTIAATLLFYAGTWVVALVAAVAHVGPEHRHLIYVEAPFDAAYAVLFALLPLVVGAQVLNLANARLGERLRKQASTDELTGLLSRRALHEGAARWQSRTCLAGHTPTLLLIDVDHFKAINDTRGHHAGDDVLRTLSERMRRHLPAGSLLARYGGEEFLALVAAPDCAAARDIADSLRDAVRATPMTTAGGGLDLTVSIGVSAWACGADFRPALTRADLALYAAKAGGRDRVVVQAAAVPA